MWRAFYTESPARAPGGPLTAVTARVLTAMTCHDTPIMKVMTVPSLSPALLPQGEKGVS